MAIRITEDGTVIYENEPDVARELFPNIPSSGGTPEQITQAVNTWLEEHPEATTTVEDGSITKTKLDSNLQTELDSMDSEIGELKENLDYIVDAFDFIETAGYITGNGEISSASQTMKEVYTSLIPVEYGEVIGIRLAFSASYNIWVAYALYDSNRTFLSRPTIYSGDGTEYEGDITINSNQAAYISFTYRTYGDCSTMFFQKKYATKTDVTEAVDSLRNTLNPVINGIITNGLNVSYAYVLEKDKTYRFTNIGTTSGVSCYGSVDGNVNGTLLINGLAPGNEQYVVSDVDYNYIRVYRGAPNEDVQLYVCGGDAIEEFAKIDKIDKGVSPIVTVGARGDYQTIISALKANEDNTIIHVLKGTYNIVTEYTSEYGSEFWDNYNGYLDSADKFMRGLWVGNNVQLIFDANTHVVFDYTGSNNLVHTQFSPFATSGNCSITGLDLTFSNCRYAIHDDYNEFDGYTTYKNCKFNGVSTSGDTIGGGVGRSNTYIFEGCVFLGNTFTDGADISYHNNAHPSNSVSSIYVRDCYGENNVKFKWYGTNTEVTECIACGNSFKSIATMANTATPHDVVNMHLTKWNNIETA